MITIPRTRKLYDTWKPPSWNPTAAGFIPISDAEFNTCRPTEAFCINLPFSYMAQGTTQIGHISARLENSDAPARHFAVGALIGWLTRTHHTLATEFTDPHRHELGSQFRTRICLERLRDPSGNAVGFRIWKFVFDATYRESLNQALQMKDVADTRRARADLVMPLVGTAAHKRITVELEAYRQYRMAPNPAIECEHLASSAELIRALHHYSCGRFLSCGRFVDHLKTAKGHSWAISPIGAANRTCSQQLAMHAASPEFTLCFGRKGLHASLPANAVSAAQLNKAQYAQTNGFHLPDGDSWLFVGGNMMAATLPLELQHDVEAFQSVHGTAGMKYVSSVRYEAIVAAS